VPIPPGAEACEIRNDLWWTIIVTRVPAEVFFSYSHRDENLRDRLETHLALL
jgi:hypothetical protein